MIPDFGLCTSFCMRVDTLNFFELVLFCYLTGNNDMHLKNFSVIHHSDHTISLSPAYDLLNVNLVFPDDADELARHIKPNYFIHVVMLSSNTCLT